MRDKYFKWLCDFIYTPRRSQYKILLKYLHGVEFTYFIPLDENRAEDGLDLRHRFCEEQCQGSDYLLRLMVDEPCSLLEMMVALSIRCEDHIMVNQELGDRTDYWFWGMIDTSGLFNLPDVSFNSAEADVIINRILNREYGTCGEGGLFYLKKCNHNVREMEIWDQLGWYLDEYIEENEYE